MFATLVLALVWTFNLSALVLTYRADLLRRVVLNSWELLVFLCAAELGWSLWALWTSQPAPVVIASTWLGINLLVSANLARQHARELKPQQVVLLCSWWIGLLAMMGTAVHLSGLV